MKKTLFLVFPILLAASAAHADRFNVDLGIQIGTPYPPPVVVSQPPVIITQPPVVVAPPPVVMAPEPYFWPSPGLGVHVAVGGPCDMFWFGGNYYQYHRRGWLAAPSIHGPWHSLPPRHLPPGLAHRKYRDIVRIRDIDYRHYRRGPRDDRKYDDDHKRHRDHSHRRGRHDD
ncbi:MAG: hypothetical protein R2940_05165 [Syntrophotaleaceae bacterium]